jgi:hypothetical protein
VYCALGSGNSGCIWDTIQERYDHSDMFAKVAPLPPDKKQIDTVSVSAGNDIEI